MLDSLTCNRSRAITVRVGCFAHPARQAIWRFPNASTPSADRRVSGACPRDWRAFSSTATSFELDPVTAVREARDYDAACPICQQTKFSLKSFSERRLQQSLFCPRCSRSFLATDLYTDLTLEALPGAEFKERYGGGVEIFRSPLVSWVYERGWRQNFSSFGFPHLQGVEEETQMALEYLRPAWGETLMDLSCGSGLFSRRFIKSGKFSGVIASDFSENMLKQTSQFIAEDPAINPRDYTLVRMDAGRLPFETGSLAAVHAGAALHCWPNPSLAVAEISRVLKPGGVFVASTILNPSSGLGSMFGDENLKPLKRLGLFRPLDERLGASGWNWFAEGQLREMCARGGLVGFECVRRNWFIMLKARRVPSA